MKSILIVDSSALVRSMLSERLHAEGFIVHGASDAAEAEELLTGVAVDVVVLEPRLLRGDGAALLQTIRNDALFGVLPVVIYTSDDDSASSQRLKNLGVVEILHKDRADFSELLQSVRDATGTGEPTIRHGGRQ